MSDIKQKEVEKAQQIRTGQRNDNMPKKLNQAKEMQIQAGTEKCLAVRSSIGAK